MIHKVSGFPFGVITVPQSKSVAHRAMICAMLAGSGDLPPISNEDIAATYECMKRLLSAPARVPDCDCGESGSTLRFLLPIAAALGVSAVFLGKGRLLERPIAELEAALKSNGAVISHTEAGIAVSGQIRSGVYSLPGNVSSQYISGLFFALPLLEGDSEIIITSPIESASYLSLTIEMLNSFNVDICETDSGYHITGGQKYAAPTEISGLLEGDWSAAAFFLCASGLGKTCEVRGLNLNSAQSDRAILDILVAAGAEYSVTSAGGIIVSQGSPVDITIDAREIPDIIPPLAAFASAREGAVTRIINAGRLRLKESDRLAVTHASLTALGCDVSIEDEGLVIRGKRSLSGGTADSAGDHRIAMTAAVAACASTGDVFITDSECVKKSFPNFWETFERR